MAGQAQWPGSSLDRGSPARSAFQGLYRGGLEHHKAPVIRGQNQEQKEEEDVEELANNHNESGQNTLALLSYTVVDITSGVAPQDETSDFVTFYNNLQDAVLRQSYNECKYARIWDEFEHGDVNEERAHNAEVIQDKASFEDKLAREEANFQLQQTQRQEEFQWACLA